MMIAMGRISQEICNVLPHETVLSFAEGLVVGIEKYRREHSAI